MPINRAFRRVKKNFLILETVKKLLLILLIVMIVVR